MNLRVMVLLAAVLAPGPALAGEAAASFLYSSSGIFGLRYATLPASGWGYWGEFKFNAPDHSPAFENLSRRTVETVI